jgi:coenzyme F420-reducing hydrogenase delta subunit
MCTGRIDLSFILRAFQKGADGVFIGGCWPRECHYVTEGNYDALATVLLCNRLLAHLGLRPERLRLEWVAASEGARFAEVINEFVAQVREAGPLRAGGKPRLAAGLDAAQQLVPYLKLVEQERLRVPERSEKATREFYASDETEQLLSDLVTDKLVTSQILNLLAAGPASTAEIATSLGLEPFEVSKQMKASSRHGWVCYDVGNNRFALAGG